MTSLLKPDKPVGKDRLTKFSVQEMFQSRTWFELFRPCGRGRPQLHLLGCNYSCFATGYALAVPGVLLHGSGVRGGGTIWIRRVRGGRVLRPTRRRGRLWAC